MRCIIIVIMSEKNIVVFNFGYILNLVLSFSVLN